MKERKPDVDRKEDTKGMRRKELVAISRLRTGYTRATHGPKMERVAPSATLIYLSTTYCGNAKKTEDQRTSMDMNKEQWINRKKGMEKIRKRNRTVQRNIETEKREKKQQLQQGRRESTKIAMETRKEEDAPGI
jgi:hypothetical protein